MFTRQNKTKLLPNCRITEAGYKNSGMCKLVKEQAAFGTELEENSEKHS
jgi:hypothetical protein